MSKISYLVNGVDQRAEGFYKVAVVDSATDEVVWEMPEFKKNLILNTGMDLMATNYWAGVFQYGIAGTGTRPNSIDSAPAGTTASQSGTTVTATGGTINFTTDAAVGDVIKWGTGETANVVSITDSTHLTVDVTQTVASGNFVIWKTSQTGLQTEVKRSNTYLPGAGNCGTTITGNQVSLQRTIDFSTETGSVTYTEVGFSPVSTANTAVFSRILLGAPVAIASGQRLRVVYVLNITLGPSTPNAKTAAIGGWPVAPSVNTNGNEQVQVLNLAQVNTNGLIVQPVGGYGLEPADTQSKVFVSPVSTALQAVGSAADRSTNVATSSSFVTLASYTNGTYLRDKTGVLDVSVGNRNDLMSMGIGGGMDQFANPIFSYGTTGQGFTFLFSQPQTKANTQTLSLTFRFLWSRVLA